MSAGSITSVRGVLCGHFTDARRPTGCTVILTPDGAVAGVDVRGAAPGTRETELLSPLNAIEKAHAILLSGGSAFGLDAAGGVMRWLEERGVGVQVGTLRIPIVPAAILFDLSIGDPRIRPDAQAGYAACEAASDRAAAEGNVGAGAGAIVGKLFGIDRAMKGGIGSAAISVNGITVAAIVAVNAVGDIVDPASGRIVAGARSADGRTLLGATQAILRGESPASFLPASATTLGVVATDALLTKAEANKLAQMSHDGLARSINPAHTRDDGDTIFALATGASQRSGNMTVLGTMAAEVVSLAVLRAVNAAESIGGNGVPSIPAARDFVHP
ncbi:MAG: P1 family peptidase [Betaproteobacteria bacterium]|nr:MAG: P1 family peptidase [Betaproteobacteria bacterium]